MNPELVLEEETLSELELSSCEELELLLEEDMLLELLSEEELELDTELEEEDHPAPMSWIQIFLKSIAEFARA